MRLVAHRVAQLPRPRPRREQPDIRQRGAEGRVAAISCQQLRRIIASRFATVAFGAVVAFGWSGSAGAQTKLNIGCTATTDCASAMVALDEGIFARNGLDVTMTLIGLNSNIPAALLSDSIQIGGPTPSVMLQAIDGGLDLVAVAGASSTSKKTVDTAGVVATPA